MYDDWLLEARSELERQCVDLCDLLCATRARTGDLTGAVDAARRRIQLQPLEEVGYRTLMQLQADLGDRAGAVSTYHHCASVLERELGVVPDPATRQAFQRLMADADPAGASLPAIEPAVGRSGLAAAQLVGRSRELGLLQDLWRAAAAGQPGLALVRGGAGVGKTRLVAEVAELARLQGAVVASSQCFGTSGRLALAPVADWLRNPAVQSATATLDPAWRAEVDRLVPAGGPRGTPRGRLAGNGRRLAAPSLLRGPRAGAARRSAARCCWSWTTCSGATRRRWRSSRSAWGWHPDAQLLVAGTLRDDSPDEDPELADWIVRMRATGLLTELSLSPLEAADTARLAEAISGRPLPADRHGPAAGDHGRFPAVRHRGSARHRRSRQRPAAGR